MTDEGKKIHDFGVKREVELLEDATAVNGTVLPQGSVVTIDRHFENSVLVEWNLELYEIPADTMVKQYVDPPEIFIPAT